MMPRNGSGVYIPPSNSWNPPINGAAATGEDFLQTLTDLSTGLTQSVSSDGQTPMTGPLQMGGNVIQGLGAPVGVGQALRWQQLIKGADIASASTIAIPNEGELFDITGTTTISNIEGSFPGRVVWLRFTSALTINNTASLICPYATNLTPASNEIYAFCCINPGVWQCITSPPNPTEVGSNSNGQYRRSWDGWQICTKQVSLSGAGSIGGNTSAVVAANAPWPAAFSIVHAVSVTYTGGASDLIRAYVQGVANAQIASIGLRNLAATPFTLSDRITITGIGRGHA